MAIGRGIATVFVLSMASAGVAAQQAQPLATLELEDLMKVEVQAVFGASKFVQTVLDAPSAVSLVTARDIETFGYRTLGEIIRSVPGFNVTYDRNYTYVGVRGFQRLGDYNSRVLVLVDGHRLNDPIYDMAYLGTEFPIDVQLIDRVELIRGPAASIYGTNAFFAVINVITRTGQDLGGLQGSADAGSLRTWAGRATFGRSTARGLNVLLSGSRYHSAGQSQLYFPEYDDPATNHGIAQDMDGDDSTHLFGSIAFKGFLLQGVYGTRTKTVPTASYGSWFNDPRFTTTDAQGWIDLRYVRAIRAQTQVTGRLHYDEDNYSGRYPSNSSETNEPSISVFGDYGRAGWWGASADINAVVAERHKIAAGVEYRDNFRLNQGGFDVASGAVYLDDRRQTRYGSAFVEDQFTLSPKLLLNGGIRADHYEGFGLTTNPRLALIFKPVEKTAIKAIWGTAFRAPNAYERYYSSDIVDPNPALRPETIRTGEIVFEKYVADHYRFMVNGYYSRIRGLISQTLDTSGHLTFQNLDAASTRGVEVEGEGRWPSGLTSRISYSHQSATDLMTHMPLVNSARQLATANLTVPLFRHHVLAGIDLHAVGRVQTLNGSFTHGFVVPNLTLTTRDSNRGFHLAASVYNLLNSTYGYPGGEEHAQNIIYQDGRTFRVSLTFIWGRTP
jgi:iron complex outermembrane receptor protein